MVKAVGSSVKINTLTNGVKNVSKFMEYSSKATCYYDMADELENAYAFYEKMPPGILSLPSFTNKAIESKYMSYIDKGISFSEAGSKVKIFNNVFGIGSVLSAGLGFYCTHNFCEDLINKLAECYEKNASKRNLCYEEGISYFDI